MLELMLFELGMQEFIGLKSVSGDEDIFQLKKEMGPFQTAPKNPK
jgi:hypothetical protein